MKETIKEYYLKESGHSPYLSIMLSAISFGIGLMCVFLPISVNETDKPYVFLVTVLEGIGIVVFSFLAIYHRKNSSITRNLLSAMCWFNITLAVFYICSFAVKASSALKISMLATGAVLSAIILVIMMRKKEKYLTTQEKKHKEPPKKSASAAITLMSLFAYGIVRISYKIFPRIIIIYAFLGIVVFGWLCAYYVWFSAKQIIIAKTK